jgi:hypothetical protein
MAKKTTLNDIAALLADQKKVLAKHGELLTKRGEVLAKHVDELRDLTTSVAHVVEHMATRELIISLHTR